MVEAILPAEVAVAATRDEIFDAPLFAAEESVVAKAVEKRRREFTTARACARAALTQLGVSPQAIPSGPKGAPEWPSGVVGSITHCAGYRASAVGRASEFATIGIDAEPNEPLPDGLLGDIALPEEIAWLRGAVDASGICWDRLLFSAKESVYKAWFPLAERWLGFEDAIVTVDRERGEFEAKLLVAGPRLNGAEVSGFRGRWAVREGIALTAIAVALS